MKQKGTIDRDLIKKVLDGDSSAFEAIISNTKGLVIQIIYKMVRNHEDRKDLAQEVYLKVYDKLDGFKFNSKLSTWIATITYNTCLNYLKKKKIPILDIDKNEEKELWEKISINTFCYPDNQTEAYIFKKERSQILTLAIEKLPPLYKTLITLYHNEELSYSEITDITGLPEGTVKNYLYRARKKLKENLSLNYKKEEL
ncbi:RNA polymerase sigma-70 factor (ECF subfamily) [Aquimarina sp. EL_43]|uniref:RNA polymerase sigma factor n=1 Tax=unclassified Aquimarina TaxID=2627091 RepID=UPI0018CA455E|nr:MULTISPECIES: RNA polymerase sigma factor [unclassified Aquimarina]MBG6128904.1 RNA polymerase sigma-70 factor (ECF subfamily) [Aquimarina sp. EL_35]MBG6149968.1 RNA polymerase sigma-70 factor (ECF subfamily) [Aquimarina sp. EL_32]MBG6167345.1 RNA polymerase sigma-70 factor (ECF subfamily) [Aquimarina sp. EL_43]